MRRSKLIWIFPLAFLVPGVILAIVFFTAYNDFTTEPPDSGTTVDYTVTPDGKLAWAAMRVPGGQQETVLRLVDLADEKVLEERVVPTEFNHRARLYAQDDTVYLVVPLGDEDNCTWGIYDLRQGRAPRLLSDTLRMDSPHDEPTQWQNRLIFTGKNAQGRYTMMFLEGGEFREADLEAGFPRLAGYIKSVGLHDYEESGKTMPVFTISIYDEVPVYVGPWLEPSGLPPLSDASRADDAVEEFIPRYYTPERMLVLAKGERAALHLSTANPADLGKASQVYALVDQGRGYRFGASLARLEAPTLFNARLHYLDRTTVLAIGTAAVDPKTEPLAFLYDCATGSLDPLPADTVNHVFVYTYFESIMAWTSGDLVFIKNVDRDQMTGVVLNPKDGTIVTTSAEFFEGIDALVPTRTMRQFLGTSDGQAIGVNLAVWVAVPLIVLVVVLVIVLRGRRRTKEVARGVHLEATVLRADWTGVTVDEHYQQIKLALEFAYRGNRLTETAKCLVEPGQSIRPGDVVYISYNPESGKVIVLNEGDDTRESQPEDEVPLQESTSQRRFATITSVQPTGYTYKDASVVQLGVALENGQALHLPMLESPIAPYSVSEVLELDVPDHDPSFAAIASRSPDYRFSRHSLLKETTPLTYALTRVDDPGIVVFGKKLLGLELVARLPQGTLVLSRALFADAAAVLPVGAEIPSEMEPALLDRRVLLQNKEQAEAVVAEVQYTGVCYGVTPFCRVTVTIPTADGTFIAEEGMDVTSVPRPGQRVWVGYDPLSYQATIIRPMEG